MTAPVACLQCNGLLGLGDRYCAQCGAELWWCANCGELLLQSEETCSKCGNHIILPPDSQALPDTLSQDDSPWAEVVARLRRATQGEFEIGHELGRGGMAAVFLAHELSLHRDVAIKVMSPGLLMGEGMVERFRREAITIAHLTHPNIVSVFSVRAAEGLHFFVMRCVQGCSLEQIISDAGKLPLPIVRSILHQVGSALAYAHRFKVIHRDIKPANILIDEDGNAVVTDFGIAKAAEGPSQTHTGLMVGTPAYMSPEQCVGGKVSGASDQYSLGVVAYETVTGVPPFAGSTYTVIQAHVEQAPRPLRDHCDCPPELEAAILRMLAKSPDDRWPGMPQALSALGAAPLAEDDPLRRELSRLATAGGRTSFLSPGSQPVDSKSSPPVVRVSPPEKVPTLTILPPPPGLEVGDSFLLVARIQDSHAARLPSGPVEWSSDSPGVLRVNAATAVATASSPGSALVRAVCDQNQGRLRVTVAPPRADVIVVKSVDQPIMVGAEVRLEATARDKRGRVVTRPVAWRSGDDSVATISLDGVLVGRSGGNTRITAELDEARADIVVNVLAQKVAAVHISAAPDSVVAGDSFALTATPLDRWAGSLDDRTVTWNVSDVAVAIITAGGWVITRNPGLVILTAVCEGISASISVNVLDRAPASLPELQSRLSGGRPRVESEPWELRPEPLKRERRRSRRAWVAVTAPALLVVWGLWAVWGRRPIEPSPPSETAVASRDSALPDDRARKALGVADASGDDAPTSVTITQRLARPLPIGSTTTMAVEVRDSSGRVLREAAVAWSSTDPTVLSIDSSTGSLRAVGPGWADIVAAVGTAQDSERISVSNEHRTLPIVSQPASLSITPPRLLRVGDTVTLQLIARDRSGNLVRAARASWSSSNPDVAEVNTRTGRVTALIAGSTFITARSGSGTASLSLSVAPTLVASVDIAGARPLKVGDSLRLTAAPRDSSGGALSDRLTTWSSSDPDVIGVDSMSGVAVGAKPGSADIVASSEGRTGRVRMTVLSPPLTSRVVLEEAVAQSVPAHPPVNPAADRQRVISQMRAGVEQCYSALQRKDVTQIEDFYKPATKSDHENLKKLARILRTREWGASIGERKDGAQRIESGAATMDFEFVLTWKDAFGGHLRSRPVFRAEFTRTGGQLELSSCRIVGSPKL